MDWSNFEPADFEYDFERDELLAHRIKFKETVECFYNDFQYGETNRLLIDFS